MTSRNANFAGIGLASAAILVLLAYFGGVFSYERSPAAENSNAAAAAAPVAATSDALPADKTGGFDGALAFKHVEALVAIGSRPPASPGIARAQEYIRTQLKSFGCAVEEQDFSAQTPVGRVAMKNILAKVPGTKNDVILLMTHYDTRQRTEDGQPMPNFVGANDGGSSTGLMLEMARLLCKRKNPLTIWIAFLDGEEAFVQWSDTDSRYGSRNLAASLALSGELARIRAVILADMIGDKNLNIKREELSSRWLVDMVWSVAHRLGYKEYFLDEWVPIEDDHIPFRKRNVAAVDLIDLDYAHWHTPADTLDKISARSIGIVGHVILETLPELEKKFAAK